MVKIYHLPKYEDIWGMPYPKEALIKTPCSDMWELLDKHGLYDVI